MTLKQASRTVTLIVLLICITAGCGYRFVGRDEGLLAGRQVAVAIFANRTYRPTIEGVMTKALRAELAAATSNGSAGEAVADLLVNGVIERLSIEPVAYTAADQVKEYRLTVTASAGLTERRSGQVLWQGREIVSVDYPTNTDLAQQQNAEEAAVNAACRQLAERFRLAMATGF
ncbi:MAG TPA: LptE family protein [Geobacteraceae bacterium]